MIKISALASIASSSTYDGKASTGFCNYLLQDCSQLNKESITKIYQMVGQSNN